MSLPRWQPALDAIDEFRSHFAEHVPPFELVAACDKHWTDEEYRRLRPHGFPRGLRGVYFIFDDAETLQYIGVATGCFDKRVWSHGQWLSRRYTDIIALDDSHIFLAPSLEYFLITRLRPMGNSVFRTH